MRTCGGTVLPRLLPTRPAGWLPATCRFCWTRTLARRARWLGIWPERITSGVTFKARRCVIFRGPHAYISPTWYQDPGTVPTWNYVTVHAYGTFRPVEDRDALHSILKRMVAVYEGSMPRPWSYDPDSPVFDKMLREIVGFEIEITRLEGKHKLNQNHPVERRERVVRALQSRSDDDSKAIAKLMAEMLPENDSLAARLVGLMKYRKLRIAWSVAWGVVAVLLIVLWVRSYWWAEVVLVPLTDRRPLQLVPFPVGSLLIRGCLRLTGLIRRGCTAVKSRWDSLMVRQRIPHEQLAIVAQHEDIGPNLKDTLDRFGSVS